MARAKPDAWLNTDEIAAAVQVSPATIRRWGRERVLPAHEIVPTGRRGTQGRWPLHTADQARWVLSKLEAGFTFGEIRSALAAGEYKIPGDLP